MSRTSLLTLTAMAAALEISLPMPIARAAASDAARTDADSAALEAAKDKRARKAAKRLPPGNARTPR